MAADLLFNSLERGQNYTFVFGHVDAMTGVFHEILSDGCLLVVSKGQNFAINPDRVIYVKEAKA